jgi:RHS repeat-associated protein
VSYGYDSIYRLTSETIASDPNAVNGAASYVYDPVGNRTQKTSTIPGYPGGLTNYNANDQISTDSYDNDGNTTASNGVGYVYDFENHLVQAGGGISIVYDGDGNRVSKTVAGVTTTFLVDDQNPTGYAQVVYESTAGSSAPNREVSHTFVYGLEPTLEQRIYLFGGNFFTQTIYFVFDGHGSVRALTDQNGAVTDTYDYDAFGNLLHQTGTTPNNYRFAGEQFDPDLNLYFNRARYLNTRTGRFWTMDTFEGDDESPSSLHKYLYATADPINEVDPSGRLPLSNTVYGDIVHEIIEDDFLNYLEATDQAGLVETNISGVLGKNVPLGLGELIPDMVNLTTKEIYDIKAIASAAAGATKIELYLYALNRFDPRKTKWRGGMTFRPRSIIRLTSVTLALVAPPVFGLITYEVVDTFEIYFMARLVLQDMLAGLTVQFSTATALAAEGGL